MNAAQKLKAKIKKAKEQAVAEKAATSTTTTAVPTPTPTTTTSSKQSKQTSNNNTTTTTSSKSKSKPKVEAAENDLKVAKTLVENNTSESPIHEVMIEICTGSYDSRFVGFCYRYFTSNDPAFETVLELPQAQLIKFSEQQKLKDQPLITTTFATKPHAGSINQLLSTKKFVITTGYDELALVYDLVTRRELRSIPLQQGNIIDAASLRDQYTAFATANGVISLHAGAKYSFTPIWEKVAHKGPVASIAIHPSGRLLLSVGQNDNKLRVWDMIKGSLSYTVNLGKHSAEKVRFSPKGDHFFVHYREKVVIHDTESLEIIFTLAHEQNVTSAIYVNDYYVATGTQDGKITIWDLQDGACLQVLDLHENRIKSLDVKEINVGEFCLSAVSSDGGLSLWRLYLLDEEVPPALLFYEVFNVRLTCCCLWIHFGSEHQAFLKERKLAFQNKLGIEGTDDQMGDDPVEDSDSSDDDYEYVMEQGEDDDEDDEMQDDE